MIWEIVKGVLGLGSSALATWQENRAKEAQAKSDLKVAYLQNKTRLLLSKDEANHAWEMAALANSSTSLKWGSFILFAGPIGLTFVMPMFGATGCIASCWDAMNMVPEYWRYGFTAMTGSIWGVAALKDMGGVGGLVGKFASKGTQGPAGTSPVPPGPPQAPSTGLPGVGELVDAAEDKVDDLINSLTK